MARKPCSCLSILAIASSTINDYKVTKIWPDIVTLMCGDVKRNTRLGKKLFYHVQIYYVRSKSRMFFFFINREENGTRSTRYTTGFFFFIKEEELLKLLLCLIVVQFKNNII